MEYIEQAREGGSGCVFCDLLPKPDEEVFILGRTDLAFAVMNIYPYNPGHLLIAPLEHVGDFRELSEPQMAEIDGLLKRGVDALDGAMSPDGYNIGMNLGRTAGAGVPGHVHWHIVPRWNGDSNFLAVTADTRSMPELVTDTYEKLRPRFA